MLRAAFINTGVANCSIYESGRMVYECIKDSALYEIEYFSLDDVDISHLSEAGRLRCLGDTGDGVGDQDFWVFNWHFITMAMHLNPAVIAALPGPKFTIVLELAPENPLQLVPPNVFQGYIALDPTALCSNGIYPFPRPLPGEPRDAGPTGNALPTIGSFGFGTPGKGFELLVEAVNRAFDAAVVRINVPRGSYVGTDPIHREDYATHVERICRKIAKPGVELRFTNDFMEPEAVVDWCEQNDLNCFMYTRQQPGLSATTDQAIISGRPLLTLSNDTFRHIHRYIPPYPTTGLAAAIQTTPQAVRAMQRDWSRQFFNRAFHRMLPDYGLLDPKQVPKDEEAVPSRQSRPILVVGRDLHPDLDLVDYTVRFAAALGRSGDYVVHLADGGDIGAVADRARAVGAAAVVLVDLEDRADLFERVLIGTKLIRLAAGCSAGNTAARLEQRPIVPFFTVSIDLELQPAIWLIGFKSADELSAVVDKIFRERPEAILKIERPKAPATAKTQLAAISTRPEVTTGQIAFVDVPNRGVEFIHAVAAGCLVVIAYDLCRHKTLEAYASLAMTTERPVFFTRAAPFAEFGERARYLEDVSITEAIEAGLAAHVGVLHDFGEWWVPSQADALLRGMANGTEGSTEGTTISVETMLGLRGSTFVDAAYRSLLGRWPDSAGLKHYLDLLEGGASRAELLVALHLSPEGRLHRPNIVGLNHLLRRHRLLRTPLIGPLLRLFGWGIDAGETDDVMRHVRALENRFASLEEAREASATALVTVEKVAAASDEAVPLVAAAIALSPPPLPLPPRTHLLLVGTEQTIAEGLSGLTLGLEGAVTDLANYRVVLWDREQKRLRLASAPELTAAGLSAAAKAPSFYPASRGLAAFIEPGTWATDGWLIVSDTLRTADEAELIEMNVILEARRIGLRTAFTFTGATPLKSPLYAGTGAEGCELFMQSLLLADLAVASSTEAASDLDQFFTQHQLADFHPPIEALMSPTSPDGRSEWADYLRRIEAVLSTVSQPERGVGAIYYLLNGKASTITAFDRDLMAALSDLRIPVHAALWSRRDRKLVPVDLSPQIGGAAPVWTSPGQKGAKGWVLCPAIDRTDLDAVQAYARGKDLRTAAVVRDGATEASAWHGGLQKAIDCLAGFDKIFTVSDDQLDAVYRMLLSTRRKFHSATHRLECVPLPPADALPRRREATGNEAASTIEVLVHVPAANRTDLKVLSAALSDAAAQAPKPLRYTIAGLKTTELATLAKQLTAGIVSTDEPIAYRDQLLRSDFSLVAGGPTRSAVQQSLARRIPVVCDAAGSATPIPGVSLVDFSDRAALAAAVERLAEPDWAKCLQTEAASAPRWTWSDYARSVAGRMGEDRCRDQIVPATLSQSFAHFTNLAPRPKLSICISTYNRGGWIDLNLQNLFEKIGPPTSDIEILVVDNASTDSTEEVAAKYIGRRSDFRYIRNPRNVGMLGNLAVTAQRARGEFVWVLGDDDFVRDGVIQKTLKVLSIAPETELVYFNYGYTSEPDPSQVESLDRLLNDFNVLEPDGPDVAGTVAQISAKDENFYTAIYAFAARRDHAMRAYCQDTSGRTFATMISCIPTAYYVLNFMADSPAYWLGTASLVVNSNVSWAAYGALLDLEHLPHAWDVAERMGAPMAEVDRRRSNRLWLVEMMWREIFENDAANNSPYFSASRTLMRLKHLPEIDQRIPEFRAIYQRAHSSGHPAAGMDSDVLFAAFPSSGA